MAAAVVSPPVWPPGEPLLQGVQVRQGLDLIGSHRQDGVPGPGQGVRGGQQLQVSAVAARHRFQVEVDAVKPLGEHLGGSMNCPAAGHRVSEVETAGPDEVSQPRLDPARWAAGDAAR